MRPFPAITVVACLIAVALPATARADGMPPKEPGCHCPRPVRHVVRRMRRPIRRIAPALVAMTPAPAVYYNPLLANPWDSDRAMVLHYRSPPVAGIYYPDPGYTATPDVAGVQFYKLAANGAVYQFDGLVGQYVALAAADAARALPPAPPAPPPPAAAGGQTPAAARAYIPKPPPQTPLPLVP